MNLLNVVFSTLYSLLLTLIYGFFFQVGYEMVMHDHMLVGQD